MSLTGTINVIASAGGQSVQGTIQRTAEGGLPQDVTLPAGQAGTLTTRTDDNTGVATLTDTPSVAENDIVDVYWTGGVRYGMVVGIVAVKAVPLEGGVGDVLPAGTTALVVTEQVSIDAAFDGDNLEMLAIVSTLRSHVDFWEAGATAFAREQLASEPFLWATTTGVTNPLAGKTIATIRASNGVSTAAATLKIALLYDS